MCVRNIMFFPYQCLVARRDAEDPGRWTLFGASGSQLVAQTSKGATSVWSQQDEQVIVSAKHALVGACSQSNICSVPSA
jgi:hypothetical protein